MLDKVQQNRLGPKDVIVPFSLLWASGNVAIRFLNACTASPQLVDATTSPQLVDAGSHVEEQSSRKPRMDSEVGWVSQVTP